MYVVVVWVDPSGGATSGAEIPILIGFFPTWESADAAHWSARRWLSLLGATPSSSIIEPTSEWLGVG